MDRGRQPAVRYYVTFIAWTTLCSQASAKCYYERPAQWFFYEKSSYDVIVKSDNNGCGHSISRFVQGKELQKVVIMKQPSNGSLKQLGESAYYYIPRLNFKGKDNYVMYICGRERQGSGCARFNFLISVE